MDVADKIMNVYLQPIRDWQDSLRLFILLVRLTSVSLVVIVEYTIISILTSVLTILYAVIIEVFLQGFASLSVIEQGKSTSRFLKRARKGSALPDFRTLMFRIS